MMFAVAGQSGSVILFVVSGLGVLVLGTYFLCLAAHYYLLTVQETAVGLDEVQWPNDTAIDWMPGAVMLLLQVLLWIMPAGFAARFLAPVWMPDQPALRFAILMGLAAWLLFPPGLLLSTASSQAGRVATRLLRSLPVLLLFYVLSGALCVAGVAVVYFAIFGEVWLWLLVAVVVVPMVLLWHARLLGRLGWQVGREEVALGKPEHEEPTAVAATEERPRPKRKRRERPAIEAHDPWAVPEEAPIEADLIEDSPPATRATARSDPASEPERVEGYGLAADEPPPRPPLELPPRETREPARTPRKRRPPKLEPSTAAEDEADDARESAVKPAELERERRLREREELPPPRSLFFHGVWEFPLYSTSLSALAWLMIYGVGAFGLARFMVSVWPFGGGAE
jgi:hypothetical protein